MNRYNYKRRESTETKVGDIGIGGNNPIRLQSMTNTSTMDTEGCIDQALKIAHAGGDLIRLTTQGVREASNMKEIRIGLDKAGCRVPIVADVHFNPSAAFKAVETCEKVRINPGNFVDPARTFKKLDFTDEEYEAELEKIKSTFIPFLNKCKEYGTAIRLGVNHGSLSDRIMSRYGDTPEGMVESAMEYLRICRQEGFDNVVISIKSSNVGVMVQTVELLSKQMEDENMKFPLHLGVTEAGDAEDGRIKSAVGIGTLLGEGLGDTIRVSLTENPENEIPVARKLRDYVSSRHGHSHIIEPEKELGIKTRSLCSKLPGFEKTVYPIVLGLDVKEIPKDWHHVDTSEEFPDYKDDLPIILETTNSNKPGAMASWIERFVSAGGNNPIILKVKYPDKELEDVRIKASADLGPLLLWGYGCGIWIEAPEFSQDDINSLALGILQATRLRISKTEYIACPSCGRTLFDLQKTLKEVKEATKEMKGLKIGVMGCIVNGPGEMADADYGYVGAGPGKISLYKGKELIKKNIPSEKAISELLELIHNSESEFH
ncbi:MAG: (E)-4-hydroxy-3-methylbut-2-enyl-diphosphate synthase [Muribaculaceae bacterium]|nr:(E)-4-hydroxy-3-methylbut-2-enyl-diphosphate synthase [Muribaculaceae bacterium]